VWHNNIPLVVAFPRFYDLSLNRVISVDKVVTSYGRCLAFMIQMWAELAADWLKLLDIINSIVLFPGKIE
jgi:hypothetical protein